MRRNGSENRFQNNAYNKKGNSNTLNAGGLSIHGSNAKYQGGANGAQHGLSHLPTALQDHFLQQNSGTNSTKNLSRAHNQLFTSGSRSISNNPISSTGKKYSLKFQQNTNGNSSNGPSSRNGRKYERNVSNARAYLGVGGADRNGEGREGTRGAGGNRDRNGNVLPSALQNIRSHLTSPNRGQPEEQKRAASVASGDTIISTASSSSPMKRRPLHVKKNLNAAGLQIAGQGGGSSISGPTHNNVKARLVGLQKYSKFGNQRQSPYIKKSGFGNRNASSNMRGTGASNTDSELYGKSNATQSLHQRNGNSGIGSGSRNVSVSLAQKQAMRRE